MLICLNKLIRYFWLFGGVFLAVLLSSCQPAETEDTAPLAKSLDWMVDKTGQLAVQDIQKSSDWISFDGKENWGIGTEVIWVRYALRAALPGEIEPWIIRVRPSFLEELSLYDPSNALHLPGGSYLSSNANDLGPMSFNFQIQPIPHERFVYLRLQSQRSKLILTEVMSLPKAYKENLSTSWLAVLLITVSISLAIWSSLHWSLSHDKLMGVFAIKQWVATGFAFSMTGFSQIYFGDITSRENLITIDGFIRIWSLFASIWFLTLLIMEFSPPKKWVIIIKTYLIFVLFLPLLQLIDMRMEMTLISNIAVMVGLPIIFCTLFFTPQNDEKKKIKIFLLFYLFLYTLITSSASLLFLNWISFYTPLLKANFIHIFIDAVVVFIILQIRAKSIAEESRQLAEKNQLVAVQLSHVQQQMAAEQQRRQEQSQFLHMLMHELKTPLSVVSLALGTKNNREANLSHASAAVQDMKAIIDRCILADQSQDSSLVKLQKGIDLPTLVRQITESMPLLKDRFDLLVPRHLPHLKSDEQLLKIILSNLLDNAAHYSDPLTPIKVRLDEVSQNDKEGLRVCISNTPGLAGWPDERQLFSKYYRAPGAERESGSGLGLYLSQQLVQSLSGSLSYAPTHSKVEFLLWIPLHPA